MTHNTREIEDNINLLKRYLREAYPDPRPNALCGLLDEIIHHLQKAREEERERIKTTIETLLLGVQPLPEDADTFMGEHEKTVVRAGYMVKEWVMEAFKEPDHSELDQPTDPDRKPICKECMKGIEHGKVVYTAGHCPKHPELDQNKK